MRITRLEVTMLVAVVVCVAIAGLTASRCSRLLKEEIQKPNVEIGLKVEPCNASPLMPEDAPDGSMGMPTYTFSECEWRGCWKHKAAADDEWPDEWVCSPGCRMIEETMEVCCGSVD